MWLSVVAEMVGQKYAQHFAATLASTHKFLSATNKTKLSKTAPFKARFKIGVGMQEFWLGVGFGLIPPMFVVAWLVWREMR